MWLDGVNVLAGGSVTVRDQVRRLRRQNRLPGHILDHEDLGMMGTILAG
ncbi:MULTISPECIES: hypothetical protein [unclassified Ornithinimicrobium]